MLALIVSQLSTLFSHQRCCQEAKAEGPQENSLLSKQAVFKSLFEWVQCFMKSRVETPTCFQNVPVSEVSKWNLFKVYFIIYRVHRSREDKSEAKFVFNACSLSKDKSSWELLLLKDSIIFSYKDQGTENNKIQIVLPIPEEMGGNLWVLIILYGLSLIIWEKLSWQTK